MTPLNFSLNFESEEVQLLYNRKISQIEEIIITDSFRKIDFKSITITFDEIIIKDGVTENYQLIITKQLLKQQNNSNEFKIFYKDNCHFVDNKNCF